MFSKRVAMEKKQEYRDDAASPNGAVYMYRYLMAREVVVELASC